MLHLWWMTLLFSACDRVIKGSYYHKRFVNHWNTAHYSLCSICCCSSWTAVKELRHWICCFFSCSLDYYVLNLRYIAYPKFLMSTVHTCFASHFGFTGNAAHFLLLRHFAQVLCPPLETGLHCNVPALKRQLFLLKQIKLMETSVKFLSYRTQIRRSLWEIIGSFLARFKACQLLQLCNNKVSLSNLSTPPCTPPFNVLVPNSDVYYSSLPCTPGEELPTFYIPYSSLHRWIWPLQANLTTFLKVKTLDNLSSQFLRKQQQLKNVQHFLGMKYWECFLCYITTVW